MPALLTREDALDRRAISASDDRSPASAWHGLGVLLTAVFSLAALFPAAGLADEPGQGMPATRAGAYSGYLPQTSARAGSGAEGAERFEVKTAASSVKIDGRLDEPAWQAAALIPLVYEWLPGDNIPAPVRTECLVTYDLHALYIAFRCFDPEPGRIRAHLMDRDDTDNLILDDHVSVMIDPFNDERRGFQFRANPLGVQADAIFSELEGYEDFSWDAIWQAAGRVDGQGYTVEMAIPLNQLRFKRRDGPQTWGFSAERSWPRGVRHRMTSHKRSRNVACILCQFNKLTGFEGVTPSRNVELNPTLTGSRTDRMDMPLFPDAPLVTGKAELDPGLTAKWGVTPNLILNAAVNPDFSQVEADVAQLDINRRFALFYPEKRPFFLEGADFFLTPINAVFTRTLADPAWGVKMTGKLGRTAVGFFSARDEITNLMLPANQGSMLASLDQDSYGAVFRLRQDVGRASTLGVLYTGRAGDGYYNHLGGFDGFIRFDQKSALSFQYLHSETKYPGAVVDGFGQKAGGFGGDALNISFQHMSRHWIVNAQYEDLSPDFRADSGFVPRVDTRQVGAVVMKQFWGDKSRWFDVIRVGVMAQEVFDYSGRATDKGLTVRAMYAGPLQTSLVLSGNFGRTLYSGAEFDYANFDGELTMKPVGGSEFGLEVNAGGWIDFENVRPAVVLALGPRGSFSLTRHLNLNLSHDFERLTAEGAVVYKADISQVRLVYNFSVRAFVRAILQYRDFRRNQAMYPLPVDAETRKLFTQFLFSYKLNPRTVLFLGYTDNSLGYESVSLTRTDRTFFLKIGYAWQL